MKANAAYERGLTGKGVTIAVIDTGIDLDNVEFAGRLSPESKSFDSRYARCGTCAPETISFGLNDIQGHGTATASVAAGAANNVGMQGIAPDATILALKIASPDLNGVTATTDIREGNSVNSGNIAPAINYAVEKGAFVINLSLNGRAGGQVAAEQRAAMDYVRAENRLLVQSVDNFTGDSFAGQITENLVGTDMINREWILLGIRVDANLQPPGPNGVPGALADRTLAVVAHNVPTADINGGFSTTSGNSFASPAIAGAAALLKEYWPQLGGREISRILLDTATDLGEKGVDQIFGVGLLNLENSLKAQAPSVHTSSAAAAQDAVQSITFSGAFGSGEGAARWSNFAGQAVAIDKYGRDYQVNLGLAGSARAAQPFSIFGAVMQARGEATSNLVLNQSAALVSNDRALTAHPVGPQTPVAFAFRASPNTVVRGQAGGSVERSSLVSGSMFRVLGVATHGSSISIENNGFSYGFSAASTNRRGDRSNTQALNIATPLGLTFGVASSREDGSALGLRGAGNFAVDGANSTFLTAGWSGTIAGFWLTSEIMAGRTTVNSRGQRLSFDPIISSGFRLQADREAFGGLATFGFTSPLKVERALVSYTAPVGFNLDTLEVVDYTRSMNLAPDAREMNFELGWVRRFGMSRFSVGGAYGLNSGNQQGHSAAAGWFRLNTMF